ncbi:MULTISPECIES: RNA polymerase sigma factor [unclassified Bacillus (in: firmicutes)]|uniref:RNA polymerase sigma factor n=1 Tax=unclassified Bacillus (in: firmicutes) TaxID=185979 RepID=UPI00042898FF|nr:MULTISPECIES: RNA polymerase sigma factor [unclassified Bacillus (in: firmicutes)]QHZ45321.1 RNA polymerase sigma factor [Bacillus sp. NSP9.1]WFA04881.1 RNA polymerase sigma factor [Bacillus sp. HSf4]
MNELNQKALMKYCMKITGDKWDAEDLVQDTFLKLMEINQTDASHAYQKTVAKHKWIDRLRKRKRECFLSPEHPLSEPTETIKAADEFAHLLKKLSDVLTPKQLTIFLLKDVFSFQLHEIAEALNKPESSVKSLLFRSRQRLKGLSKDEIQREAAEEDHEYGRLLVQAVLFHNPDFLLEYAKKTWLSGASEPSCQSMLRCAA